MKTDPAHSPKVTRRSFLQTAAATAPLFLPSRVLGLEGATPPSERVNVGLIGLGGRCHELTRDCLKIGGMRIAAVCDCNPQRVDSMLANIGSGQSWKGYTDFREMIEKENLDAVMVETTTHARAWVACHAMAAGVDVYIEKPMALTIAEGREMVDFARRTGRVTQVGTQQRSIPLNNWASDLVKNGAIGKVKTVLAGNFVGPQLWAPKGESSPPADVEKWWDVWTNQAVYRPYHPDLHLGWVAWRDYDGGGRCFGVTGWGAHALDQVNRALGTDDTGPVEVVLDEEPVERSCGKHDPRRPDTEETGAAYYALTRDVVGPRAVVRMRFESGPEVRLNLDGDRGPGLGAIFAGEDGKLEINRDKVAANPRELLQSSDNPGKLQVAEVQPHVQNWLDCIKTREKCNADIEIGQRASTLCCLVNIAREVGRVGEPLAWDPLAERFTNCDEGNALLARERRRGYELPV